MDFLYNAALVVEIRDSRLNNGTVQHSDIGPIKLRHSLASNYGTSFHEYWREISFFI